MKYFIFIILFILLTGCSVPGSAFLGPAITGVTTKSAAQASLSFGSKQVFREITKNHK